MPAPYVHTLPAKLTADGGVGRMSHNGATPLKTSIRNVLGPGRAWNLSNSRTAIVLTIKDEPDLTAGQLASITSAHGAWDPEAPNLAAHKELVRSQVDGEIRRRILQGFVYGGVTLSLSREAQINWLGLDAKAGRLTYPYTIRSINDQATYAIVDEADAHALADAAFDAVEAILANGRTVKASVMDAVDVAAVDAAAQSWLAGGSP